MGQPLDLNLFELTVKPLKTNDKNTQIKILGAQEVARRVSMFYFMLHDFNN